MSSRNFFGQYWLAFVWIAVAVYTIFLLALVTINYTRTNKLDTALAALLIVGIGAALYRNFRNGFRFRRESAISEGGLTGLFLNIVLWGFQIVLGTVIWSFVELLRQIRFLAKAWNAWKQGSILVADNGRRMLAG